MRVLCKQNPHLFFVFLSKSSRSILEGSMHPSGVVVGDLSMDRKDQFLYALIIFGISEFELKFAVIRFLCSVLPRRSFMTHGDDNSLRLEKIQNHITRIFRSLVRMKVFRNDSPRSAYRILDCRKYELFGMMVGQGISDNLFGKIIQYRSKIDVDSLVDNMCKITPPYNMRSNGAESGKIIHNL